VGWFGGRRLWAALLVGDGGHLAGSMVLPSAAALGDTLCVAVVDPRRVTAYFAETEFPVSR
jgi:hypothetical protein